MHERSVNPGEGTTSRENVGHDRSIFSRSVFRKPAGVADDGHVVADLAHHGEPAFEQRLAAKIQESLIGIHTHAGTLASGKEEASARPFGSCHIWKSIRPMSRYT